MPRSLLRLMSIEWCHPTISSSVTPFSCSPQSFPHQGLFQKVTSSHQVAKELELKLKTQPFRWIFRVGLLEDWLVAILAVQGTWEVGSHFLLQGILPTQEGKPGLLHCRQILYCLSHQRSPKPWTLVRWMISASSRQLDVWTCVLFSLFITKATLGKTLHFPDISSAPENEDKVQFGRCHWRHLRKSPMFRRHGEVYTAT